MLTPDQFYVVNIPLNRPSIHQFLRLPIQKRGAGLKIVTQRPTAASEHHWFQKLSQNPSVETLIERHNPHQYLVSTTTDRLVPIEFLHEADYLTRNLGGWGAVYFAVISPETTEPDPLLDHAEILATYGDRIRFLGADAGQVARRLEVETGMDLNGVVRAFQYLHDRRAHHWQDVTAPTWRELTRSAEEIHRVLHDEHPFGVEAPELPRLLVLDELMGQLVWLEQQRRDALAEGDLEQAEQIQAWQEQQKDEQGLFLILKGEYIMGRHRRSTVLIAPELNTVVKQPAPEPFHEAVLNARIYEDLPENIPALTQNGELVMPTGRIRIVLEDDLISKLDVVFDFPAQYSSLLGISVEPFVEGPTLQDYVLADPSRLNPDMYRRVVICQQICEALGIENGDWHSANFIVANGVEDNLIHIDWGAARPLRKNEYTPDGIQGRLDQIKNIAFSYHNETLAARSVALHEQLTRDRAWMNSIEQEVQTLIASRATDFPGLSGEEE